MDRNDEDDNSVPQRLVVFVGPHQSSATAVRDFFIEHCNNGLDDELPEEDKEIHGNDGNVSVVETDQESRQEPETTDTRPGTRLPVFENWTWPYIPRAAHPKALGDLVLYDQYESKGANDDRQRELWSTILAVWGHNRINSWDYNSFLQLYPMPINHVILGTEEFDRLPLPQDLSRAPHKANLGHRDALAVMKRLVQLTGVVPKQQLNIVVNYRTPRASQWISVWNEWVAHRATYKEWMCDSYLTMSDEQKEGRGGWKYVYESQIMEVATTVANPLRIAHEYRRLGWNVSVMDLGGIAEYGLDVSQVIACEVLGVPCIDGWVKGLRKNTDIKNNLTTYDTGLSNRQIDQIEHIFLQRDCYFYYALQQAQPGLTVHRAGKSSLWTNPRLTCGSMGRQPTEFQVQLATNSSVFVSLLRAIVACSSEQEDVAPWLVQTSSSGWYASWSFVWVVILVSAYRCYRMVQPVRYCGDC